MSHLYYKKYERSLISILALLAYKRGITYIDTRHSSELNWGIDIISDFGTKRVKLTFSAKLGSGLSTVRTFDIRIIGVLL